MPVIAKNTKRFLLVYINKIIFWCSFLLRSSVMSRFVYSEPGHIGGCRDSTWRVVNPIKDKIRGCQIKPVTLGEMLNSDGWKKGLWLLCIYGWISGWTLGVLFVRPPSKQTHRFKWPLLHLVIFLCLLLGGDFWEGKSLELHKWDQKTKHNSCWEDF